VKLESFVFPRNQLGHLDLLPAYGFRVVRGSAPFWFFKFRRRSLRRAGHVLDDLLAIPPNCGLPEKSPAGIWIVPVSMFLQSMEGCRRLIPAGSRIKKGVRGIESAIRDKSIFHLSFHPTENLCFSTERIFQTLETIIAHAARRRDEGLLDVMTMSDIGRFCDERGLANQRELEQIAARELALNQARQPEVVSGLSIS
jgi:hypothetical protein